MKKVVIAAVLVSALVGIVSTVQANHSDWTRNFWEEQDRNSGN
jgi:cytosine/uracil/thiamine/allantoin permease